MRLYGYQYAVRPSATHPHRTVGRSQQGFDVWRPKNPNVHLARSDVRGYLRLSVKPERLHADLVAVDDIKREDSPTHVLAAYDVADGRPGVVR